MLVKDTFWLIVPILVPLFSGLYCFAPCMRQTVLRERFLAGAMALEVIFSFLAAKLHGNYTLASAGGVDFVLMGDTLGGIFSVLFAVMFFLCGIFGFEYLEEKRIRSYYAFYLLTLAAMQGLCYAGTMLTFYLFYEMMTLMSLPLVIHERTPEAMRAGFVYLGYSLFGAALALFGFFMLSAHTDTLAFTAGGIPALFGMAASPWLLCVAMAVLLGFGTKAGLMPMHFWLPTAHPVAPAPASAVLSGCITKAGVLGILRMTFFVFGAASLRGTWVQTAMLILSLVTIFGGSMLAYQEQELKKRLAWSTVSQAAYVIYGLFLFNRTAFTGAILQSVFHSVGKVLLFLCAGAFICKTGKRRVADLTGLGRQMPVTAFCFAVAGLSLVGIPPFAGFVSKWYLAEGSLSALPWGWVGAAVLLLSALLTAGYLMVPTARMFFPGKDFTPDARVWAGGCLILPLILLAAAALWLGLFPAALQDFAEWVAHSIIV